MLWPAGFSCQIQMYLRNNGEASPWPGAIEGSPAIVEPGSIAIVENALTPSPDSEK